MFGDDFVHGEFEPGEMPKKTAMLMNNSKSYLPKFRRSLQALLASILLLAMGSISQAGNFGNPGVLPPHSGPHGKSYGEWAAAWFQWALSIPADRNPLTDETGEFAGEGQEGPVWFGPGTFGNSVERSYSIPAGKAIFVPVYQWIFGAGVFDCDPTVPGVPCVVCDLRDLAAANTEAADIVEGWLDGVRLNNMEQYRAFSPEPFSIVYPENSVVGVPAGTYFPQVTDGYWLMLAPLATGSHELHLRVRAPGTIFGLIEYEVIHHITVTNTAQ
jgi:hypothetical protein